MLLLHRKNRAGALLALVACWGCSCADAKNGQPDSGKQPEAAVPDPPIAWNSDRTPPLLLFAHADLIVRGKITKFADKEVRARGLPGSPQDTTYQVSELVVAEVLCGKKLDRLTLGSQRDQVPESMLGKDAIFFLMRHHSGLFYCMPRPDGFFVMTGREFDVVIPKEVNRFLGLLADPKKSLQSKDSRERLTTAAILVNRYRVSLGLTTKTAPVDQEESTLILDALASVDWHTWEVESEVWLCPLHLFQLLDLDGWNPPPKDLSGKELGEKAKRWIRENRETYRIPRFLKSAEK